MNPTSTTFAGLTTAGQSFSDPAGGATITLESISATGAVINVQVPNGTGGPTCIDGTTLSGTGGTCDGGVAVIPPFDAGESEPDAAGAKPDAGAKDAGVASAQSDSGMASDAGERDATVALRPDAGGSSGSTGASGSSTPERDAALVAIDASGSSPQESPVGTGEHSSGCSCESVGASPTGASGAWASLGALGLVAVRTKRRRAG